jgi:predicted phage terminase large subunit-like protein
LSEEEKTSEKLWKDLRAKCMGDLYFFAKAVLGFNWLCTEIHLPLCRILEQYQTSTRVRLVLPRGWLKTTLASQAYPLWRAIRNPNIRVLLVQNTYANSVSKLRTIRSIVEGNGLFRWLFPELLPDSSCIWKGDSLCLKRTVALNESTFEAAGIRTQVTSRHYELIIEDDTVAPDLNELGEENLCPTKDDIDQAIGWHRLVPPLLVNPMTDQILVVGTRWFERDLMSWIEDNEKNYLRHTRACMENEKGEPDMIDGKPTYEKRFNMAVLDELQRSMGPYLFSCLYQNAPTKTADMVFKSEWILHYEFLPPLTRMVFFTTIDPAGDPDQVKGDPDYNVVMTCAKDVLEGDIYVVDYFRKKCSPGEVIKELFRHVKAYAPLKVGIETVAYQNTLCYWIKEQMRKRNEFFTIEPIRQGRASKSTKIMGLQPVFASGTIRIRSFMTDLTAELLAFPYGRNDDIIDALAMQVEMWIATQSKSEKKAVVEEDDPMTLAYEIARARARGNVVKIAYEAGVIMEPLRRVGVVLGQKDNFFVKRSLGKVG